MSDEKFAKAVRAFLEVEEDAYHWDEHESGLDHYDGIESISEIARYFFEKGRQSEKENAGK